MFKGRCYFNKTTCPNDGECTRPYCPFKHSPAIQPKVITPPMATASSSARKLPSYAPQNSPSEPKMTVDYKQLLRGCKSYKSPGREAKPNNLFDKFKTPALKVQPNNESRSSSWSTSSSSGSLESNRQQPQYTNNPKINNQPRGGTKKQTIPSHNSLLTPPNLSTPSWRPDAGMKKQPNNSDVIKSGKASLKPQQSLFEKLGSSIKQKESDIQLKSHHNRLDSPKYGDKKEVKLPKYNAHSDDDHHGKSGTSLVYKPGVGIMSPDSNNDRDEVPKKESSTGKQRSKFVAEINSSLDFHDPYNSIPEATSPTKADLNKTFSIGYEPFKSLDSPVKQLDDETDVIDIPSSQESTANASLVIEETSTTASFDTEEEEDIEEELLSEEEEEEDEEEESLEETYIESSPSPSKQTVCKSKYFVSTANVKGEKHVEEEKHVKEEKHDIEELEVIEMKTPKSKDWLGVLPSNKDVEEQLAKSVFGGYGTSPVKSFKRTFQKKKSPDVIEIDNDGEEDFIAKMFEKDLEDQSKTPSDESPSKGSTATSHHESEKGSSDSESTHNTSVASNLKSTQSEEDEPSKAGDKSDKERKLEEIKNLKAKIFIKQYSKYNKSVKGSSSSSGSSSESEHSSSESATSETRPGETDSDFSIDSNKSVKSSESSEETADTATSPSSESARSSPKRKRKRYSSPIHSDEENSQKTLKPVIAVTPKQIKEKSIKQKVIHTEQPRRTVPLIQPPLKKKHTIKIVDSPESSSTKRKKAAVDDKGAEYEQRKRKHEEEKRERRRMHDDSKREHSKKRRQSKPGVSANIKPDKIIPHRKQLSDKKMKIMDQYDKRMHTENTMDNTMSFYQKKPEELKEMKSKYKKQDLSHFDPPTPPPDNDPHRWGLYGRKNRGKRIAHNPSAVTKRFANETKPKESKPGILHKGGPRIDISRRTHVPANVRQTRLDCFITEYLKIWPDQRQRCYDESVKDEKSCLDRCKTKQLYTNLCTNTVVKIRDLKGKSNGSSKADCTGSSDKSASDKQRAFYEALQKYKLSKEDLKANEYPGYYEYKAVVLDGLHCVRCSKLFQLDAEGEYIIPQRCIHHNGKLRSKKSRGAKGELDKIRMYSCCDGADGSMGCGVSPGHVHNVVFLNRNWINYTKTRKRDTTPCVWALDCEMSYTAGGVELIRVTVVDIHGKTAIDMLVQPPHKILDYNTRFSGISAGDLENVEHSLEDAQRAVCRIVTADCFIIGHSLESDLHALKLIHKNVIDTSILYYGGGYKRGLSALSAETLGRIIQQDDSGHDSTEDAIAALDLVKHKLKLTDNIRLT